MIKLNQCEIVSSKKEEKKIIPFSVEKSKKGHRNFWSVDTWIEAFTEGSRSFEAVSEVSGFSKRDERIYRLEAFDFTVALDEIRFGKVALRFANTFIDGLFEMFDVWINFVMIKRDEAHVPSRHPLTLPSTASNATTHKPKTLGIF